MPWYKHEVTEKIEKDFKEKEEQKLEGTLTVMPDCGYKVGDIYYLTGLGSIFNGVYRVKRCTHTVLNGEYRVILYVVKKQGGGGGGGEPSSENYGGSSKKEKAPVKLSNEVVSVNKATGVIS